MIEDPAIESKLPRCRLFRRLAAIAYDSVIVTGLLLIAAAIASPLDLGGQQAFRDPLYTIYLAAVWYLYLASCWKYGGMTVGMRAWKIIILTDEGLKPGWKTGLLRFAASLVSTAALGLGFIWSLLDAERRAWHDISSRSGLYRVNGK